MGRPSRPNTVSELPTTRRTFFGLVGVATVGAGVASASESDGAGFGVGGYGEGGFGIGGYRTVEYYAGDDGIVDDDGVASATEDWKHGLIDTSLLLDVINAWVSGDVGG